MGRTRRLHVERGTIGVPFCFAFGLVALLATEATKAYGSYQTSGRVCDAHSRPEFAAHCAHPIASSDRLTRSAFSIVVMLAHLMNRAQRIL